MKEREREKRLLLLLLQRRQRSLLWLLSFLTYLRVAQFLIKYNTESSRKKGRVRKCSVGGSSEGKKISCCFTQSSLSLLVVLVTVIITTTSTTLVSTPHTTTHIVVSLLDLSLRRNFNTEIIIKFVALNSGGGLPPTSFSTQTYTTLLRLPP